MMNAKIKIGTYFLLLPMSHRTRNTISAMTIMPVHIPALKMPSMASQLLNEAARTNKKANDERFI